jgi:hypothetical protein
MDDGWFRGLWLWLSWLYFNNNVNYLVDSCFIHVIVLGANIIPGLIKMAKILKVMINY